MRLTLIMATAGFYIGGYGFWIASKDVFTSTVQLEREFAQERQRAYATIGNFNGNSKYNKMALTGSSEGEQIANSEQDEAGTGACACWQE
jgi:hypothetical protein